jgi:hypothetical protein
MRRSLYGIGKSSAVANMGKMYTGSIMKIIWMCAVLCFLAGGAIAAKPAAALLAEELIVLMKIEESMKQGMEISRKAMLTQTEQMARRMGEANAEQFKAYQTRVLDLIEAEMSWDKIKQQYIELYASVFTESELRGLIEFYRSPVGQAYVRKQPELMQKSMELNQRMMMNLQPKMMKLIEDTNAAFAP